MDKEVEDIGEVVMNELGVGGVLNVLVLVMGECGGDDRGMEEGWEVGYYGMVGDRDW